MAPCRSRRSGLSLLAARMAISSSARIAPAATIRLLWRSCSTGGGGLSHHAPRRSTEERAVDRPRARCDPPRPAMTLRKVEGQPRAVETLRAALRSGAIHHAYLFTGPEGVGRELAAVGFVQALFCAVQPNEGCGECDACVRVERMSHPD